MILYDYSLKRRDDYNLKTSDRTSGCVPSQHKGFIYSQHAKKVLRLSHLKCKTACWDSRCPPRSRE